MPRRNVLTDEQIKQAIELRLQKPPVMYRDIADMFGCHWSTIRKALRGRVPRRPPHRTWKEATDFENAGQHQDDARAFFAELRARGCHTSMTAAFCGDPLPGRSALDQRNAGAG
jgi:hypothetical protein